jgi:hypothetical protein
MTTTLMDEIKRLGALSDADHALLVEMRPVLEKIAPVMVDSFYAQLEKFERTREILHAKPGRLEVLRGHLVHWLVGLADGSYDEAYFKERYRIGQRHVEVGLEPRFVIAAMSYCRHLAAPLLAVEYAGDPRQAERWLALDKIMDINLNIMLQSYDDQRIQQFLEVTGFSKELFENMIASSAGA